MEQSVVQKSLLQCKKWLITVPLLALGLAGCGSALMSAVVPGAVTADELEQAADLQYQQLLTEAKKQNALVPANNAQNKRLQTIAQRLIPYTYSFNPKAESWNWQVSLIRSKELNAFCMPGGKIAFYTGLIDSLKLTDDEIAIVMGHEMVHALREHSLTQINKTALTNTGLSLGASAAGVDGNVASDYLVNLGTQLMSLQFSRSDESEADRIGQEIAARAGYNPQAAISLWEKMDRAGGSNDTPTFLRTHPQNSQRITDLKLNLPNVMPLYEEARRQGGRR
ncbi:Metalloprotease LoiP [Saezia sanguinis]|jgi:predicted Zn-dependent protease|uniref:Metalloprotease LoiP n=1 Tax=Saezia sanguinis TaxID=1965230 RepID=A0A433SCL5_9BURK|nr:M48 family metalloprotease [Saezia sanguinis]RUS66426.1 Metalloprotease LoiP [Saezia sanguinis]